MLPAKLQSLNTIERRALAPGLARLLVTRLLLVSGIRNTSRWLGRTNRQDQAPFDSRLWEARGRVLQGLGARLPGMACLTQSLALRWWMRAAGLDARMKIGVRQTRDQLKSHAWVELAGRAIAESEENIRQFRVIDTY
jgi:hypothetical protein